MDLGDKGMRCLNGWWLVGMKMLESNGTCEIQVERAWDVELVDAANPIQTLPRGALSVYAVLSGCMHVVQKIGRRGEK